MPENVAIKEEIETDIETVKQYGHGTVTVHIVDHEVLQVDYTVKKRIKK